MKKNLFYPFSLFVMLLTGIGYLFFTSAPVQSSEMVDAVEGGGAVWLTAILNGEQEVPAVDTNASGVARFTLLAPTTLEFELAVHNLTDIAAAHIHSGTVGMNGGVIATLYDGTGVFDEDNPIGGLLTLTEEQSAALLAGNYYVNVHTTAVGSGEIRGQIYGSMTESFQAGLSGANEVPPIGSPAYGQAYFTLSADMSQLYYRVMVHDIMNITAAHVHEAPAGMSGGVVFPLYGGEGEFAPDHPIMGVITPTIDQVATLMAGDYYVNVHTAQVPSGELRGQLGQMMPSMDYHATLVGGNEVPAVDTNAVGLATFSLSDDLSMLHYEMNVTNIVSITAAHIHMGWMGQNGGVAHTLYGGGGSFGTGNPITGTLAIGAMDILDLMSGYYYVNVHTVSHGSGEIRGQIGTASLYHAMLSGDQEVPAVDTPAMGKSVLALSADASKLYYRVMVSNIPTITAAHIHMGAMGQSGGVVFGLYDGMGDFDENTPINGSIDVTPDNVLALLSDLYYINVHTVENGSGEIRGQIEHYMPKMRYEAALSGDQEVPAVDTPAMGMGHFNLTVQSLLHYYINVTDIMSVTASHIHVAPVGQNGGVSHALYTGEGAFDADNPIGGSIYLTAPNLVDLLTGYNYVNVHTETVPSGEIRGQIMAVQQKIYLPMLMLSDN